MCPSGCHGCRWSCVFELDRKSRGVKTFWWVGIMWSSRHLVELEASGPPWDGFEACRLTDLGAKNEGCSYWENHVVEVRRALDHEVTESPYLARQLLMFDDRQPIIGAPRMVFRGLQHTRNLTVNTKRWTVTLVQALLSSNSFYIQSTLAFCVGLIGMIVYIRGCTIPLII